MNGLRNIYSTESLSPIQDALYIAGETEKINDNVGMSHDLDT